MRTAKAILLTLVVLALSMASAAPQTQSPVVERYPDVLNVALGIGNVHIAAVGVAFGTVRFRVSTDGARVSAVSPLEPAWKSPSLARRRGIAGQVTVRVEQSGERVAVSGPAELRQSALENLRSWDFSKPRTSFDVVYNYSLVAGDCGPQQNPTVRMELPYRVEIVAKRPIACSQAVIPELAIRK